MKKISSTHTIFTSNVELGQGATGQSREARDCPCFLKQETLASPSGLASGTLGQHYMTDVKLVSIRSSPHIIVARDLKANVKR